MYEQMKKNSVSSANQLKKSEFVRVYNEGGKGVRVMFAGNSITLHGIKEDIGWNGEWGMAASDISKDYVHLLISEISKKDPDAAFCICQVAEWERSYKNGSEKHQMYSPAKDFDADIIVARFIENCPSDGFDCEVFKREYSDFLKFLGSDKTKIVFTGSFWNHPGNGTVKEVAEEKGFPCVELSDLGERDDMKALGLFEHEGVANHPGDKGMATIAERIWEVMEF